MKSRKETRKRNRKKKGLGCKRSEDGTEEGERKRGRGDEEGYQFTPTASPPSLPPSSLFSDVRGTREQPDHGP